MDVETLAKELHEAGRKAVNKGQTVSETVHGNKSRKFIEWGDLDEVAKAGRISQAECLLEKCDVCPAGEPGTHGFVVKELKSLYEAATRNGKSGEALEILAELAKLV